MFSFNILLPKQRDLSRLTKRQTTFFAIALLYTLFFFIGCGSELEEVVPTEDGAVLNITITGIDEIIATNTAAIKRSQLINNLTSQPTTDESTDVKIVSLAHTDIFTSAKEISQNNTVALNNTVDSNYTGYSEDINSLSSSVATPRAATAPMTTGATYRLVIFNQDNVMVVNQVATAGTNPQIRVDGHRDYTWYALSTNESSQTPNINSSGIISKANLINKDVLYASGSISTVDGNNYLDIIFRRLTARFRVKLDVRGLFGTITGNTSLSLVKTASNTGLVTMGDLNLRTGTFSSIDRYFSTSVLNAQMTNVTGTPAGTTKYADFYTLDTAPIAANNLKVQINRLDITLDDGTARSFTTASTATYASAYTPTIGSTYELTLGMVEQAVQIGGILWARTNLTYNANQTDRYRFKPNPGGSSSNEIDTEYWNWMSSTPTGATGSTDPCTLIYPNGTWRLPTQNEWLAIGNPDAKNQIAGLFYGVQYAFLWNLDSGYPSNSAYDTNNLFIAFGGYRSSSTSVSGSPIGLALGFIGTGECHYWTSTNANTTQAYAMSSSFTRLIVLTWGNVNLNAANKSQGRNIRCVRQS